MVDPLHLAFASEARALLARTEGLLRSLDRRLGMADVQAINECYRSIHTIAGLAGFLSLDRIKFLAQAAERVLEEMRVNSQYRGGSRIDALLRAVQRMSELVACIDRDAKLEGDDIQIIQDLWNLVTLVIMQRCTGVRANNSVIPRFVRHGTQVTTGPPLGTSIMTGSV